MDMYFILEKRYKIIMVYVAISHIRPETASQLFPLKRIEEMTRLMDGDGVVYKAAPQLFVKFGK